MMYTVVWTPSALRDLADLWNNATDRAAVTSAADTIDSLLARDPLSQGEARAGSRRILVVESLAVYFEVRDLDRLVTVLDVWRWR
jgi:plasmid stabilization system protein ParE